MKKALKWLAIFVGALLALLIIGIAALPFVFPLEKIKEFAVAEISETIKREVRVEKVSFDLFSGIKLGGLYVGNREGFAKKPFISADSIELRYAIWPLFSRQIIIKEIRLVKPEILVEKNRRGEFNFSDLTQPAEKKKDEGRGKKDATKPPFDLLIASFSVKDGKISYADQAAGTINDIKDFNLLISGFELALVKPIDLRLSARATYQGKEIPLSLAGKIGVSLAEEKLTIPDLSLSVAGESLNASGAVSGWKAGPQIELSLSSRGIDVDPLLAVFAAPTKIEKPKPQPGELTKTVNRALASIPRNLGLKVSVDVNNLTFQKFKVDRASFSGSLSNGLVQANLNEIRIYGGVLSGKAQADLRVPGLSYRVENLTLAGFNASPFTDAVVETFLTKLPDYEELTKKVYGTLDISALLKGHGVEPQDIFANLEAAGSLTLKNGELKRLKTLASVGEMLKSNTLKADIKFGELSTAFGLKNRVVDVKSLRLAENDFKVNYKGGVDLNRLAWVPGNRLTLKLAPALTLDLPREFSIFRDDKGWFELTFEITGQLKKPFPKPILEKPLETAVGKIKAKIEAKKIEIEESAAKALEEEKRKAEEAARQKAEEEKKRLEEEAKQKLRELIKF